MLIVDAYNVLHVRGVLPPRLAGQDVPGLIHLISLSRYARDPLTLVCDGGASRASGVSMGRARILFSGDAEQADDVIERLIDTYAHGRTLRVVSSDKRLRRAARRRGAESLASEDFLRRLAEDESAPRVRGMPAFVTQTPLDKYSVEHWLSEFGVGDRYVDPELPPKPAEPPPIVAEPPEQVDPDPEAPPPDDVMEAALRARPPEKERGPGFGERIRIDLPARAAEPEGVVEETPVGDRRDKEPSPELDPVLRAALEEWRGRLSADDLDMSRWIDGVDPI